MIVHRMNRKNTDTPSEPAKISVRRLNRSLLARQMLLAREVITAYGAIERLVGMQAQLPNSPYVGLWSRLEGFNQAELVDLYNARRVVRLAMMRSTIHLVTDEDCLALRPVVQPVLDRGFKGVFARFLADIDHRELDTAGREMVNAKAATFGDLAKRLNEKWPDRHGEAMADAIRTRVPLVQVTPRGVWGASSQAAHTSAENWLGRPLNDASSVSALVVRYLGAFGPASVMDAQSWSGLSRLREVFDALRTSLVTFRDDQGVELFDLPHAPRPGEDVEAPIRFLPEFDNVLLAYRNRSRIIADKYKARVYPNNGMIQPTVLIDGFVEAKWRLSSERGKASIEVEMFRRISKNERANLKAEGARLLVFLTEKAKARDIRISGP